MMNRHEDNFAGGASRWMWLEQLAQDVRYGARTLRRAPAFAATTVSTLAIGLALTTGLFTVFNAYVLRSFAVRDPAGLYQVVWHARDAAGRNLRCATTRRFASARTCSRARWPKARGTYRCMGGRLRRSWSRRATLRCSRRRCFSAVRSVRVTRRATRGGSATRHGSRSSHAIDPRSAATSI